jgi:hypothetical protein
VYESNEEGRPEIYARTFADAKGEPDIGQRRYAISKGGGSLPLWPERTNEFTHLSFDGNRMAVELTNNPMFPFSKPKLLRKAIGSGERRQTGNVSSPTSILRTVRRRHSLWC